MGGESWARGRERERRGEVVDRGSEVKKRKRRDRYGDKEGNDDFTYCFSNFFLTRCKNQIFLFLTYNSQIPPS